MMHFNHTLVLSLELIIGLQRELEYILSGVCQFYCVSVGILYLIHNGFLICKDYVTRVSDLKIYCMKMFPGSQRVTVIEFSGYN